MFMKAKIATAGRSESLVKSSHVKKTRYAHEVILAAFFILYNDAYIADKQDTDESLEVWVSRRRSEPPQLAYYYGVGKPST